jgi:hypothetical protein
MNKIREEFEHWFCEECKQGGERPDAWIAGAHLADGEKERQP